MSSMWRKTLIYLGLVEEPEEDEYAAEEPVPPAPARDRAADRTEPRTRVGEPRLEPRRGEPGTVRPLRPDDRQTHVRPLHGETVRVAIVRAAGFDDAAEEVGQRYRSGQPVLLDVGEVDARTGRRLLDFVSGMIFALRGAIASAGDRAFLLVPDGVSVPADERRRLADLGYRTAAPTPGS